MITKSTLTKRKDVDLDQKDAHGFAAAADRVEMYTEPTLTGLRVQLEVTRYSLQPQSKPQESIKDLKMLL